MATALLCWFALTCCWTAVCAQQPTVGGNTANDGTSTTAGRNYGTLRDILIDRIELTMFRDALSAAGVLEGFLDDPTAGPYTVLAPTDTAMAESPLIIMYTSNSDMWQFHLLKCVNNHIIENTELLSADISTLSSIQTLQDELTIRLTRIQGAAIQVADLRAANGVLHIVDKAIHPAFLAFSHADITEQPEFGPDSMSPPRTTLFDVIELTKAYDELNQVVETGLTFVGCRTRAFNRMGIDYLLDTINGSPNGVLNGELLNASYINETLDQFIEYNLIPRNYHVEDMQDFFFDNVQSVSQCGDILVTYNNGILCFNDACVDRHYWANNGIGYVVDRCTVCPGIGMLISYLAGGRTLYNTKDVTEFVSYASWNLRNLSAIVGDGADLTLFASINTGFGNSFNLMEVTRLSSPQWIHHLRDLVQYWMIQGSYTKDQLIDLCLQNGDSIEVPALNGENLVFGCTGSTTNELTVTGGGSTGSVLYPDIRGVDGIVHITSGVPLPVSMTSSTYDIAGSDPSLSIHVNYIDAVLLSEDLKRMLPVTAFFVPNEVMETKTLAIADSAVTVMQNHIFEDLLTCGFLRGRANSLVESTNGQLWKVTVNERNMPCFNVAGEDHGNMEGKACVTKCDVLARNGILHVLDELMLSTSTDTDGDSSSSPIEMPCNFEEVQLSPFIKLRHAVNSTANTATMEMIYDGEAWLGLGFGTSMVGSMAVIGLPESDADPALMFLGSYDEASIVPAEDSTGLLGSSIIQEGGQTRMRFIISLDAFDDITSEGESSIIYATGSSNQIDYHLFRGESKLTLKLCQATESPTPAESEAPVVALVPSGPPSQASFNIESTQPSVKVTFSALPSASPDDRPASDPAVGSDNGMIRPEEIFDLKYAVNSKIDYRTPNTTKYYCVFRSMWTAESHPTDYPTLAWWGHPVLFSHTKQYAPLMKNRPASYGVKHVAESGFTDVFEDELRNAGTLVMDHASGSKMIIDQAKWDMNFLYIPAVEVDWFYPFLSGIASIKPSPDWFTSFYMMELVDQYSLKFWEHFRLQTYPWDAGTDEGQTYTALDRDTDPVGPIVRIQAQNAPDSGAFLNKDGNGVNPVAEWECVLHVCPLEDPDCAKPNWPPSNGCDILKYPECDEQCDPAVDTPCEQCTPSPIDPPATFYANCCSAGREPVTGSCAESQTSKSLSPTENVVGTPSLAPSISSSDLPSKASGSLLPTLLGAPSSTPSVSSSASPVEAGAPSSAPLLSSSASPVKAAGSVSPTEIMAETASGAPSVPSTAAPVEAPGSVSPTQMMVGTASSAPSLSLSASPVEAAGSVSPTEVMPGTPSSAPLVPPSASPVEAAGSVSPTKNQPGTSSSGPSVSPSALPKMPLLPINVDITFANGTDIDVIEEEMRRTVSQFYIDELRPTNPNLVDVLCESHRVGSLTSSSRRTQDVVSFTFMNTAIFEGPTPFSNDVYVTQDSETNTDNLQEAIDKNPTLADASTFIATVQVAEFPSAAPSSLPSPAPSRNPAVDKPSEANDRLPSAYPTGKPTAMPTSVDSRVPTSVPTDVPTWALNWPPPRGPEPASSGWLSYGSTLNGLWLQVVLALLFSWRMY